MYIYENESMEIFNIQFEIPKNKQQLDKKYLHKGKKELEQYADGLSRQAWTTSVPDDSQEEGGDVTANTTAAGTAAALM